MRWTFQMPTLRLCVNVELCAGTTLHQIEDGLWLLRQVWHVSAQIGHRPLPPPSCRGHTHTHTVHAH